MDVLHEASHVDTCQERTNAIRHRIHVLALRICQVNTAIPSPLR